MKRRDFLKAMGITAAAAATVGMGGHKKLAINIAPRVNPWTTLEFNNCPENFHFAIVSDRSGGIRASVFEDAVKKLNLLQPQFVMSIGDLIQGANEDKKQVNKEWDKFEQILEPLQMPFFYVPGNHDLYNDNMLEIWHKRLGKTYYHFVYRNVLFLCMNSEQPMQIPGGLSDEQIDYFAKVLKKNSKVRHTLIFIHKPLWRGCIHKDWIGKAFPEKYWEKFEKVLGNRPYTVFCGHKHYYQKEVLNGRNYYGLATTGGGILRKAPPNTKFDHIVWVTIRENQPIVANLFLEGIYNDDPTDDERKQPDVSKTNVKPYQ
ncbi:MAG: metallophosphoesterase family protein [Planctomycetota bacterium]|jgi:hypothetical protein